MSLSCVKEVNNSSFKLCPVEFEQALNIPPYFLLQAPALESGTQSHLSSMLSLAQVLIVNVKTFQSHHNDTGEEDDPLHHFCPG